MNSTYILWRKVVRFTDLLSLASLGFVKIPTSTVASDETSVNVTTFCPHSVYLPVVVYHEFYRMVTDDCVPSFDRLPEPRVPDMTFSWSLTFKLLALSEVAPVGRPTISSCGQSTGISSIMWRRVCISNGDINCMVVESSQIRRPLALLSLGVGQHQSGVTFYINMLGGDIRLFSTVVMGIFYYIHFQVEQNLQFFGLFSGKQLWSPCNKKLLKHPST